MTAAYQWEGVYPAGRLGQTPCDECGLPHDRERRLKVLRRLP